MPALPAIELSQEHFDLVVQYMPGTTSEQKTVNYQNMVLNAILTFIENQEMAEIEATQEAARQAAITALQDALPDRLPFPV